MPAVAARETVTITLPPSEIHALAQLADRTLSGDPASEGLLHRLHEGASLATWLRERVRLELSLVEAAILRDLRFALRQHNGCEAESTTA